MLERVNAKVRMTTFSAAKTKADCPFQSTKVDDQVYILFSPPVMVCCVLTTPQTDCYEQGTARPLPLTLLGILSAYLA